MSLVIDWNEAAYFNIVLYLYHDRNNLPAVIDKTLPYDWNATVYIGDPNMDCAYVSLYLNDDHELTMEAGTAEKNYQQIYALRDLEAEQAANALEFAVNLLTMKIGNDNDDS